MPTPSPRSAATCGCAIPKASGPQIDADLALRGSAANPTLTGTVQVKDALWVRSIDTEGTGIFGLAAVGGPKTEGGGGARATGVPAAVRRAAGSALHAAHREHHGAARRQRGNDAARAHPRSPLLFGRAEVNRGEVLFEGNRYTGHARARSTSSNPTKIDPFFDIEAETRARVPGEIYRVTFRVTGTRERFVWDLSSDPPLAPVDILALLFGDMRDPRDADVRGVRFRDRTEQELIATRAARLLAAPMSSEVNKVVRKTFGVDSVVIAPSIGDLSSQQSARITPTARLTIGKRISDRLFLTYAQPITSSKPEQLVLIEYTQSDRLSWVVSRNEDETYAIDVRVRHVFLMRRAAIAPLALCGALLCAWPRASPRRSSRRRSPPRRLRPRPRSAKRRSRPGWGRRSPLSASCGSGRS